MNSNSNEIRSKVQKAILTAALSCISCDTLLVDCTPRMTDLAAGRVYTATLCTRLFTTLIA